MIAVCRRLLSNTTVAAGAEAKLHQLFVQQQTNRPKGHLRQLVDARLERSEAWHVHCASCAADSTCYRRSGGQAAPAVCPAADQQAEGAPAAACGCSSGAQRSLAARGQAAAATKHRAERGCCYHAASSPAAQGERASRRASVVQGRAAVKALRPQLDLTTRTLQYAALMVLARRMHGQGASQQHLQATRHMQVRSSQAPQQCQCYHEGRSMKRWTGEPSCLCYRLSLGCTAPQNQGVQPRIANTKKQAARSMQGQVCWALQQCQCLHAGRQRGNTGVAHCCSAS